MKHQFFSFGLSALGFLCTRHICCRCRQHKIYFSSQGFHVCIRTYNVSSVSAQSLTTELFFIPVKSEGTLGHGL